MYLKKHIIIGVDPGSICTGFGIIDASRQKHITHGHILCTQNTLGQRLHYIQQQLNTVIEQYEPKDASIEQVFTHHNIQSALKLAHARGAALATLASYGLVISEYSARQIKQAVVGYGAAHKTQVQKMIKNLLELKKLPQVDAADALAAALCHAYTYNTLM